MAPVKTPVDLQGLKIEIPLDRPDKVPQYFAHHCERVIFTAIELDPNISNENLLHLLRSEIQKSAEIVSTSTDNLAEARVLLRAFVQSGLSWVTYLILENAQKEAINDN